MRKFLIAFALLLSMTSVIATCPAQETRADAAYGVRYAQEQVVQLPQDQGRFYLSVFGTEGESRYEQVKSWIASDPQLSALKAQTTYNTYRTDSAMYRERYAQGISSTPCVRLQTAEGVIVYEAVGTSVPMSAEALYNGIAEGCRRKHCRPNPQPQPPVAPKPPVAPVNPTPVTPVTPPVVKPSDFPSPAVWASLVVGGLLIGGGVGVGRSLKKEFKGK